MAETVSGMTPSEFQELIEAVVEDAVQRQFSELLGDPDEGLRIRKSIEDRLQQQRLAVDAGERGTDLGEVVQGLGLN